MTEESFLGSALDLLEALHGARAVTENFDNFLTIVDTLELAEIRWKRLPPAPPEPGRGLADELNRKAMQAAFARE